MMPLRLLISRRKRPTLTLFQYLVELILILRPNFICLMFVVPIITYGCEVWGIYDLSEVDKLNY